MDPRSSKSLTRRFAITFLAFFLGLSVFALWPSLAQGEMLTLGITLFWMLTLAGIVSTYAIAVVCSSGDEGAAH